MEACPFAADALGEAGRRLLHADEIDRPVDDAGDPAFGCSRPGRVETLDEQVHVRALVGIPPRERSEEPGSPDAELGGESARGQAGLLPQDACPVARGPLTRLDARDDAGCAGIEIDGVEGHGRIVQPLT